MTPTIEALIADELSVKTQQVMATIKLIDEGATIPFIARYRKEATGCLDDIQLRKLAERLDYLKDLQERRTSIIKSITEQDKMSPDLLQSIHRAKTKTELEDIYRPFKAKRRNKATIAKEAGLDVLASKLLNNTSLDPEATAREFINQGTEFCNEKACLNGARQILMEQFSEDAQLLAKLRHQLNQFGYIRSSLKQKTNNQTAQKYRDYFDYHELIKNIPSHRVLALFRGRNEGILKVDLLPDKNILEDKQAIPRCLHLIAEHFSIKDEQRPADIWLDSVIKWTWRVKLLSHLENEFFKNLKEKAELEAIIIFASNLKDLLMAAPAGHRIVMGLDPALRSGVKVAVTDETGKLLSHTVIYPHAPQNQWDQSIRKLSKICEMHKVSLISIGNGTGSRETERLVRELIKKLPDNKAEYMIVSEAGASVYSASELASNEFPDLDVSIRGAVSIARRIQDPLSELVKIDPKAIGVGQYQHDVNQRLLSNALDGVVEDCVNAVGVDLNIASAQILRKVAGLSKIMAENIVDFRDTNGIFSNRLQLLKVPRLGDKAFEQCAGFLRISNSTNPLDASAVHPESYSIIEKILNTATDKSVETIIGDKSFLQKLNVDEFTDDKFGALTVRDIFKELEKPGRDPRPEFKTVAFKEGVENLMDLQTGMVLEGVISNVTNFGAFVDIGVHQDGLIHISALSDGFVSDPRSVVKVGDIVTVWVIDIDSERNRVALSMLQPKTIIRNKNSKKHQARGTTQNKSSGTRPNRQHNIVKDVPVSAFANALSDALANKKIHNKNRKGT